jgi:hypothetical protein
MSDFSVRSSRLRLDLVTRVLIFVHHVFQYVPTHVFLECHFNGLILVATSVLKFHKKVFLPSCLKSPIYILPLILHRSLGFVYFSLGQLRSFAKIKNCLEVVCNWLFGLVVWFSLRVREVLGSIPRTALLLHYLQLSASELCLGPNGRITLRKFWSTTERAPYGDRTRDHTLTKRMLCQLS